MKKFASLICICALVLSLATPAAAAQGQVTYSGDAGKFIFAPGSSYSLTDLFPDLKDVMPGDKLTQAITVKNDASNKVKVEIYMRSLGAHEDSMDFLSQLSLTVAKSKNNTMEYMFDSTADKPAQLENWVKLGMLYSGGVVNLEVTLDVPVTLDNEFQEQVGYLDWEFMVIEYPIDPSDPEPPKTGDDFNLWGWSAVSVLSLAALIILLLAKKRKKEEE